MPSIKQGAEKNLHLRDVDSERNGPGYRGGSAWGGAQPAQVGDSQRWGGPQGRRQGKKTCAKSRVSTTRERMCDGNHDAYVPAGSSR